MMCVRNRPRRSRLRWPAPTQGWPPADQRSLACRLPHPTASTAGHPRPARPAPCAMSSPCSSPARHRSAAGVPPGPSSPTHCLLRKDRNHGHQRRAVEFASHLHWRAGCAITTAGCATSSLSVGCRQRQTGSPRAFVGQKAGLPVSQFTGKPVYQLFASSCLRLRLQAWSVSAGFGELAGCTVLTLP